MIDSIKNLWEVIKPYGAVMITGLVIIAGAFASKKYLQLDLPNWQVILLISLGLILLLYGFSKTKSAASAEKLRITQESDNLIIKSANANASNSRIRIKIENIESERCLGDKVVGLPVNAEFQDECLKRKNSSAGAYINACLGGGVEARYGEILNLFDNVPKKVGSTKLIKDFLNKGDNIIFTAVTEKNDQGILTTTPINISYASQELVKTARANNYLEISCPVFGSGHGGVVSKMAIKAMIDGILGAFGVFGCNNMTVTIRVHSNAFASVKDIKKALENG
ncbi:hypothetical protein GALL_29930 [mine drainage metagenome]|uniref:Macro domain-containing protein n=1 Tax=mine drainage metagenome TaxID=410659 RepID=A0A1J5T5W3_9ZZZZ